MCLLSGMCSMKRSGIISYSVESTIQIFLSNYPALSKSQTTHTKICADNPQRGPERAHGSRVMHIVRRGKPRAKTTHRSQQRSRSFSSTGRGNHSRVVIDGASAADIAKARVGRRSPWIIEVLQDIPHGSVHALWLDDHDQPPGKEIPPSFTACEVL